MQDPHHYIHNDPHYCGNKFLLCIHKSWQQIRHGDAHDSRTQNSKAVQKHELVFTLRMSVYLHFCPLDACSWRLYFFFCLMHLISTSYLLFWSMLLDFSIGGAAPQPRHFTLVLVAGAHGRLCAFRLTCSDSWMTCWTFNCWPARVKILQADLGDTVPLTPASIQLVCYIYSCTLWVAWLSGGLINNEISNRSIPFVPRFVRTPNMYTDKW